LPGCAASVFVSGSARSPTLFKEMDVSAAVRLATGGRVINVAANSNYGHALKICSSTWLGSVTRRSTSDRHRRRRTNYNRRKPWGDSAK